MHTPRTLTFVTALTAATVLSGLGSAQAAPRSDATCSVNPDPVAAGDAFTLSASHLEPGTFVNLDVENSETLAAYSAVADENGDAAVTTSTNVAGAASGSVRLVKHNSWVIVATCPFTVT